MLSVHFWYAEIEVASKRIYRHVGEIMIPKTTGALSVSELDFHWTDKLPEFIEKNAPEYIKERVNGLK